MDNLVLKKPMKKLLIFSLLVLLTGCVNYYHPKTALEDGVYYAEDDPSYVVNDGVYFGVAYYPWSSLDYFYFGYHPYPVYPYYRGFATGYTPWHYPFGSFGFYSPLYVSYYHYPFYPAWRPYGGYCATHRHCGRHPGRHEGPVQDETFANLRKTALRKGEDDDTGDEEFPFEKVTGMKPQGGDSGWTSSVYRPYFPPGYDGDRGVFIRRNQTDKIGKSMVQPVTGASRAANLSVTSGPAFKGFPSPGADSRAPALNTPGAASQQTGRPTAFPSSRSSSSPSSQGRGSRHSPVRMPSGKSGSSRPRKKRD
jgi:hypothetical protein